MSRASYLSTLALITALALGCSEDAPVPGKPCLANSDCNDPLSCTFGKCHATCREARDCPAGQRCVKGPAANVCVLPEVERCAFNSACPAPLVCGRDLKCRNQCLADRDCATSTQKCVLPDRVCAELAELGGNTGLPPANTPGPIDAGSDGASVDSGATSEAGVPDPLAEGAEQIAALYCAKLHTCAPLRSQYAFEEDCRQRLTLYLRTYELTATDSNWTVQDVRACSAALAQASCSEWLGFRHIGPPACEVRGRRPGGAGAHGRGQCQGNALAIYSGSSCGFCDPAVEAGGRCAEDLQCPTGHLCSEQGQCQPVAIQGEACGPTRKCDYRLVCLQGVCAKPGGPGAPCESDYACDDSADLVCHVPSKRCTRAIMGTSCAYNADGTVNVCAPGSTCQSNGRCVPRSREGERCVLSGDGPRCQSPSSCVNGICRLRRDVPCPTSRAASYPSGMDPWCDGDSTYPKFCPTLRDAPWGCWKSTSVCSTVTRCNDRLWACTTPGYAVDCVLAKQMENNPDDQRKGCVPACRVPAGASACDTCAALKCCNSIMACAADGSCQARSGPNWSALDMCTRTYCASECAGSTVNPPPASDAGVPPVTDGGVPPDGATAVDAPPADAPSTDAGAPDTLTDNCGVANSIWLFSYPAYTSCLTGAAVAAGSFEFPLDAERAARGSPPGERPRFDPRTCEFIWDGAETADQMAGRLACGISDSVVRVRAQSGTTFQAWTYRAERDPATNQWNCLCQERHTATLTRK